MRSVSISGIALVLLSLATREDSFAPSLLSHLHSSMTLQFNNENPDVPRIIRYLLLVYIAKNSPMFRSYGKEMDSSVYFTLYGLDKIAESLKNFGPYRQLSRYDRTRITGSNSLIIHKCWIYLICSVG